MNDGQVRQLCLQLIEQPVVSIERKTFGHSNVVYEVRTPEKELIIRMNDKPEALQGTAANLAILDELGLPVPQVLFNDLTKEQYPFAYLILPKIPGSDLRYELPAMTPGQMTELAGQIVSFQQKVRELPPGTGYGWVPIHGQGPFGSWTQVIEKHLAGHMKQARDHLTPEEIRVLLEQVERFRCYFDEIEPRCFLDDVTIKNVIMLNGELQGIIDFDWVCYGDPLYMIGLTQTAIVADVPGTNALTYIEELCRLWPLDRRQRKVVDLYSVLHGMQFLKFLGSSGDKEAFQNVLAFMRSHLSSDREF